LLLSLVDISKFKDAACCSSSADALMMPDAAIIMQTVN